MGKRWRHVVLNTKCSWLHGDERGFRSRQHRIHSSGDYKKRPPRSEHEGLREYHKERSGNPVDLDLRVRIEVVRAFVLKSRALGHTIIACACGERHLHAEMELPSTYVATRRDIGKCKQRASYAVREIVPGIIWSAGGMYKTFEDVNHFRVTYDHYIRTRQEAGSVVWSHRSDEDWIDNPKVGIIIMGPKRTRTRIFYPPHAGV
jgi:hypothetical protein